MGITMEELREPLKDFEYLWHIQSSNLPTTVQISEKEHFYNIDLETRTIEAPKFLGAECDHESEILFFKVNRYYDGMDLSTTVCLISYETINRHDGKPYYGYYAVPFYDTITLSATNEMILPWAIDAAVSQHPSKVKFSFKFFKMDGSNNIIYNLNTMSATSSILDTVNPSKIDEAQKIHSTEVQELITLVKNVVQRNELHWEIVE